MIPQFIITGTVQSMLSFQVQQSSISEAGTLGRELNQEPYPVQQGRVSEARIQAGSWTKNHNQFRGRMMTHTEREAKGQTWQDHVTQVQKHGPTGAKPQRAFVRDSCSCRQSPESRHKCCVRSVDIYIFLGHTPIWQPETFTHTSVIFPVCYPNNLGCHFLGDILLHGMNLKKKKVCVWGGGVLG